MIDKSILKDKFLMFFGMQELNQVESKTFNRNQIYPKKLLH